MLKKTAIVFLASLVVMVSMGGISFAAEDTYYNRMTYKLGRGVSNVFFSPVEIGRSIDDRVDEYGFAGGIPIGAIHGVGRTVARIVTGMMDIVTFPMAQSPSPAYHMEPEFVFDLAQ